jgi:hypothetical protein
MKAPHLTSEECYRLRETREYKNTHKTLLEFCRANGITERAFNKRVKKITNPRVPSPLVYAVKAGDYVKIGRSNNFETRLQALDISSPIKVIPIALFVFDSDEITLEVEKKLHSVFENYHVRYEWFIFPEHDLQMLTNLRIKIEGKIYENTLN